MSIVRLIALSLMFLASACSETGPGKSILSQADDAFADGAVKSWTARQVNPDAGQIDAGQRGRR